MAPHVAIRFLVMGLLVVSIGCDEEPRPCLASAPLSARIYYDKLELIGEWEHSATMVEATRPGWAVGAVTDPRLVSWAVGEEYLWAVEDGEAVAVFPIAEHVTTGYRPDGSECLAMDERPWYERRHASIAWSDTLARADVLPLESEVTGVEESGLFGDDFLDEDGRVFPGFERDAGGRLVAIATRARYLVTCPDCEVDTVLVEHRFERLD